MGRTIASGGRDAAVRKKGNISCENIPEVTVSCQELSYCFDLKPFDKIIPNGAPPPSVSCVYDTAENTITTSYRKLDAKLE